MQELRWCDGTLDRSDDPERQRLAALGGPREALECTRRAAWARLGRVVILPPEDGSPPIDSGSFLRLVVAGLLAGVGLGMVASLVLQPGIGFAPLEGGTLVVLVALAIWVGRPVFARDPAPVGEPAESERIER